MSSTFCDLLWAFTFTFYVVQRFKLSNFILVLCAAYIAQSTLAVSYLLSMAGQQAGDKNLLSKFFKVSVCLSKKPALKVMKLKILKMG